MNLHNVEEVKYKEAENGKTQVKYNTYTKVYSTWLNVHSYIPSQLYDIKLNYSFSWLLWCSNQLKLHIFKTVTTRAETVALMVRMTHNVRKRL